MAQSSLIHKERVVSEWVDYNGHMNDAAYAKVFSQAADSFIDSLGLDETARSRCNYTIFTLETHLCYLKEVHEHEKLSIEFKLLDSDAKRLHTFLSMTNSAEELVATSEQMWMGMDTAKGKPAPFPQAVGETIEALSVLHKELPMPKQAGRRIGF
ncbi:acyl-CoA thioester hydrolase [Planomicrobium stackebrandtii]|uniref:Acyl-CoA thioester hydrolase n=1 Tax=Planomicrobium stackebrandtii TaxID=253160 RepID=A0ABU0GRJ8_9BACL|nr:thioesterase family protein [Planomicrobium stackebrandtii]MDQ0427980.1 acyl-CoA thioester hydrolase [Planomicrobium stackebrandtii]